MSTNSECEFIEPTPGLWYYILEDYNAPKNSWDWREHATCYGPFKSYDEADRHLQLNHANPGGSMTSAQGDYRSDEVYENLIKSAKR